MKGWPTFVPSPDDVEQWRRWPNPNWCLVSGEIGVFDLDIKIAPSETGPAAERARRLVDATKAAIGQIVGLPPAELPLRWRANSTSCAVIFRLAQPCGKRVLRFVGPEGGDHAVEFLGRGQQVVIAGRHASGAEVHSSLLGTAFGDLPVITPDALNEIVGAISAAALRIGYNPKSSPARSVRENEPPYSPYLAVLKAVMLRRAEWVPDVIPVVPGNHAEWRVSSVELDRDLEEDLSVYPDGIYDHGTRRDHTPPSLIAEFAAIDAAGQITFAGAPIYEPEGAEQFAVVGEIDPSVRRPTEAQALAWLCRRLAGDHVPAFPEGATWSSSLPAVARAVGLSWRALEATRFFEFAAGDEPATWQADKLAEKADTLAALQAIDPKAFDRLEFANEMKAEPADLRKIVDERRAVVAASSPEPGAPVVTDRTDEAEPVDIFAQDDPAEISTLPSDCLPPMLHRWVRSEARRKGAPESFAALAAVAVASTAVGASLRIQPKARDTDFVQPAALWAAIVAEPGRGKSPVISAAEKPLRELDAEWYAAGKDRHDRWLAASQAHKKRPRENPDPGPEPAIRRIVVDDITLEQQVRLHAQNPRGLMRSPDELLGFFGSLGQYKKGAEGDRSQALRLFEGRPIAVDRVGSGSVRADQALMGVIAGTQPQKLAEIARNLGADGMLQRFLFVVDDGAERLAVDEEPDAEAVGSYRRAIRRLASAELSHSAALKMVPDAQIEFRDALAAISRLRSIPGGSVAWRGHLDKWGLFLPRIVLTFHALDYAFGLEDAEFGSVISAATVRRAVNFARFLLRHALRLYQTFFAPDAAATEARAVAGYLLTRPDHEFVTPRTISDARKDLRSDRRKLLAAMAELEEAGWCRVDERSGEGPVRWHVNPKVHVRFQAQAARETLERSRKRRAITEAGEARKWVNSDKLSKGGEGEG
ncbi:DUF3987 domain-containing protein [Mesorhizobium sp. CO1-1-4]|uniref:DUF3987 domain-containing protein n=1 Tax=Mesorhizobium sp. CO1-1-4 TaxID=2876633 RepID=UPI001CC9E5FF|nr:DUF3987 domain-containing protein [Mesorhizobium sp. CO1-1-4]MBZ9742364.1 DUF3987 domain-containing protein [Mesorhizobium sp. CO1-1-4]